MAAFAAAGEEGMRRSKRLGVICSTSGGCCVRYLQRMGWLQSCIRLQVTTRNAKAERESELEESGEPLHGSAPTIGHVYENKVGKKIAIITAASSATEDHV